MTFEAQNNNIVVTDTNGDVVFDTGTPMPHIAQVITANIIHQFPESGDQTVATGFSYVPAGVSGCRDFQNVCGFEYVCNTQYVCNQEYQCNYDFSLGQTVCGFVQVCGFQNVCGNEYVCNFEWVDVEGFEVYGANVVQALEHSQIYTLGTLGAGTNPDFALVLLTATRTVAGAQQDYGTFVSAIPSGQKIAGNGSTVLETAFQPGGQPWLSRIVSVYFDGDAVKAEFKHSNRQYQSGVGYATTSCFSFPPAYAPPDNTASTWDITFEVYAGKFTT